MAFEQKMQKNENLAESEICQQRIPDIEKNERFEQKTQEAVAVFRSLYYEGLTSQHILENIRKMKNLICKAMLFSKKI